MPVLAEQDTDWSDLPWLTVIRSKSGTGQSNVNPAGEQPARGSRSSKWQPLIGCLQHLRRNGTCSQTRLKSSWAQFQRDSYSRRNGAAFPMEVVEILVPIDIISSVTRSRLKLCNDLHFPVIVGVAIDLENRTTRDCGDYRLKLIGSFDHHHVGVCIVCCD